MHKDGCDVERCPHCGGQALGCVGFDPSDPRRQPWDGRRSQYLSKILATHWMRTLLINAYAFILLVWALKVIA
jgi:hypothetical protein